MNYKTDYIIFEFCDAIYLSKVDLSIYTMCSFFSLSNKLLLHFPFRLLVFFLVLVSYISHVTITTRFRNSCTRVSQSVYFYSIPNYLYLVSVVLPVTPKVIVEEHPANTPENQHSSWIVPLERIKYGL